MKAIDHYENYLSSYYNWIYGGFENKIKENTFFFENHNIKPNLSKVAIDLGAGSGFQSIPLANLGFKVYSIDFSKKLLNELEIQKNNLDITIINSDILDFTNYKNLEPELIVCMGDTLTHLESISDLKQLLSHSYQQLLPGGILILSFRDLTFELSGVNRFIPVMNDEERIFTCFLDYYPNYVDVYDIVHEKINNKWVQKISKYKKLKISLENIKEYLNESNFKVKLSETANGLVSITAEK